MKRIKNKLALVKLGSKNNILYSEYLRIQKEALDVEDLVQMITNVLNLYKNESVKKQAKKIVEKLLDIGGINEQ